MSIRDKVRKLERRMRAENTDLLVVFAVSSQEWDPEREAYPDEGEVPCELYGHQGDTSFFSEGMNLAEVRTACMERGVRLCVMPTQTSMADLWNEPDK